MIIGRIVNAISKRLPSHAKDRAEEALLGLREFERLQVPQPSALTIVCDDGELKDLDIVEVLESRGVKGVFAVSPDLIGRPGFLTYDQLRSIRRAGHEIAFHGTTHDPFPEFRDTQQLVQKVLEGTRRLAAEGLGTPSTLIYPFGRHDRAVRKAIAPLFDCAFTTWFGINQGRANRYAIRRIPFGAYVGKLSGTEDWYRGLLDRSAQCACWPTLMLHPSAAEHRSDHNDMLKRLIEHALERGVAVRTVAAHLSGESSAVAIAGAAE